MLPNTENNVEANFGHISASYDMVPQFLPQSHDQYCQTDGLNLNIGPNIKRSENVVDNSMKSSKKGTRDGLPIRGIPSSTKKSTSFW